MKKELPKAVKGLKPGDRIIIIGTDDQPFETDIKGLTSVFQKILMVPRPDYGTRLALWGRILQDHGARLTDDFDLSSLAKVSDGYTPSDIVFSVKTVLGPMRKKQQAIKVRGGGSLVSPALEGARTKYAHATSNSNSSIHLPYTRPASLAAPSCQRVHGLSGAASGCVSGAGGGIFLVVL